MDAEEETKTDMATDMLSQGEGEKALQDLRRQTHYHPPPDKGYYKKPYSPEKHFWEILKGLYDPEILRAERLVEELCMKNVLLRNYV